MISAAAPSQFLFCQAVSLLLQLEQATAVQNPFLPRMPSSFPVHFFTTSEEKLWLQFLVSVLSSSISGPLHFLGTQLYLEDAGCTFQGHFWFPGSKLPSWQAFFCWCYPTGVFFLFSNFSSLVRSGQATSSSPQPWLALLTRSPPRHGHAWYICKTELPFS